MSDLRTVTNEIRENLYGLRTARKLAKDCEHFDNLPEANRHRERARRYAQTVRNIIQGRGKYGPDAYQLARQELHQ